MNLRNKFDEDDIRFFKIMAFSAVCAGMTVIFFL